MSKYIKGRELNSMMRTLIRSGQIPAWVPLRRKLIFITWLIIGNPVVWIMVVAYMALISKGLPYIFLIIMSLPWLLLRINLYKRAWLSV